MTSVCSCSPRRAGASYAEVLSQARSSGRHVFDVELDRFGATHAEFGAQLLSLWGLPATVTEPVARHHTGRLHNAPWPSVDALYVANILIEEIEATDSPMASPPLEFDADYLKASGGTEMLDEWRSPRGEWPSTTRR